MAENNRNLFSHSSEGSKNKIKVSAEPPSLWSLWGKVLTCLLTRFWWLQAIFCILRLVASSFQSVPCHITILPMSPLFSNLSHFIRTPVIGFRAHLNPVWLHLNFIISAKILFSNQVTSTGTGVRTLTYHYKAGGVYTIQSWHVPFIMRQLQKYNENDENVSFIYQVCMWRIQITHWSPNSLALSH